MGQVYLGLKNLRQMANGKWRKRIKPVKPEMSDKYIFIRFLF